MMKIKCLGLGNGLHSLKYSHNPFGKNLHPPPLPCAKTPFEHFFLAGASPMGSPLVPELMFFTQCARGKGGQNPCVNIARGSAIFFRPMLGFCPKKGRGADPIPTFFFIKFYKREGGSKFGNNL